MSQQFDPFFCSTWLSGRVAFSASRLYEKLETRTGRLVLSISLDRSLVSRKGEVFSIVGGKAGST